jgi:hypothetical protein
LLRVGREGREASLAHGATAEFDQDQLLPVDWKAVDWKALETTWSSLGRLDWLLALG